MHLKHIWWANQSETETRFNTPNAHNHHLFSPRARSSFFLHRMHLCVRERRCELIHKWRKLLFSSPFPHRYIFINRVFMHARQQIMNLTVSTFCAFVFAMADIYKRDAIQLHRTYLRCLSRIGKQFSIVQPICTAERLCDVNSRIEKWDTWNQIVQWNGVGN